MDYLLAPSLERYIDFYYIQLTEAQYVWTAVRALVKAHRYEDIEVLFKTKVTNPAHTHTRKFLTV